MTIGQDTGTKTTDECTSGDIVSPQMLLRGTTLGRYVIIELIGSGGMGSVYRAYDPKLNRGVALKILSVKKEWHSVENAKNRLMREAQALAQLSHPNVVAVHDVGSFGEDLFIAMELVEGITLKEWMQEEKRSVNEILKVLSAAGRGLAAAHKVGLIHRDFKPRNVIVGDDGRVRVLDFGLARAVDKEVDFADENISITDISKNMLVTPITGFGKVIGSPRYMAPEQHMSAKTDERTDQFSFCVVLFEALYGIRPFSGRTVLELRKNVMRNIVSQPESAEDVPGWLHQIVLKGLHTDPSERYPSMDVLLEQVNYDPQEAALKRRQFRNRSLFLVVLIVLIAVIPFGIWYAIRHRTFQSCKASEEAFLGVWDDTTKASIRQVFLNTNKPYALGTWNRVQKTFDTYQNKWMQMRSDVCEARWIKSTQSEELFDLRMGCLRKCLQELKALTKVFTKTDSEILRKAVQASTSLGLISACADEEALRAPYPPPTTDQAKREVADIREQLADAEALNRTGKYRQSLQLVRTLVEKSQKVDYRPVQAEVLYQLGDLLESTGEYKEAEATLFEAALVAGDSKNSKIATMAITNLVFVLGYNQARHEDGLLLGRAAEVILRLSGGDDELRSHLFNIIGAVLWIKAEYDQALMYYRKALTIKEKSLGSQHPEVAAMLNNIGVVFEVQGEFGAALEYYHRTLRIFEKVLGPAHPKVAIALNNMGLVYFRQGEYHRALQYLRRALEIDEMTLGPKHPGLAYDLNSMGLVLWKDGQYKSALEHYNKALAIWEKALGPNHPLVAEALSGIGNVYVDQGSALQAIAPLERAFDICVKNTCQPEPHGRALFALARALVITDGDHSRARKLAQEAKQEFGKAAYLKKDLETIEVWLEKN